MFGDHATFIIPSYAISFLVMLGLFVWIVSTHRRHKKEIAKLEAKGIKRGHSK